MFSRLPGKKKASPWQVSSYGPKKATSSMLGAVFSSETHSATFSLDNILASS